MRLYPGGRGLVLIGLFLAIICSYTFKIGVSLLDYPHGWEMVLVGCGIMVLSIIVPTFYFPIAMAIYFKQKPRR